MAITHSSTHLFLAGLLVSLLISSSNAATKDIFDIRQHLSTVTRYAAARNLSDVPIIRSSVPNECSPVHINLVARHGTRSPTKKRIKELDKLAIRLDALLEDARQMKRDNRDLQKIPSWLWGWNSPWKGRLTGGELIQQGEDELYNLGIRIRERYPEIFNEEYHPDTYNIRATQIPRASASAVAFGIGLFSGKGSLGVGAHRAFSVISESRANDIWLRFYKNCQTYSEYRKGQEPAVTKLKEPILNEIASSITSRFGLNFTVQDVASLWFLCKQEASLLDITNQACHLFNSNEVSLLEWTDDLEVFILKGYGNALNYRMGVPLLQDVVQSMEQAIAAIEENLVTYEKARLRFAHAETVVPFTCLLGLFLEGSEFDQIQREEPLALPPKPPQPRNWMGSTVAPFSGNNLLVLYSCPNPKNSGKSGVESQPSSYFVHVLHNEVPISMPGCGGVDFCPFELFKEKVVAPHLKHDFHLVCSTNTNSGVPRKESKPLTFSRRVSMFLRWLFFLNNTYTYGHRDEEL